MAPAAVMAVTSMECRGYRITAVTPDEKGLRQGKLPVLLPEEIPNEICGIFESWVAVRGLAYCLDPKNLKEFVSIVIDKLYAGQCLGARYGISEEEVKRAAYFTWYSFKNRNSR